MTEKKYSREDTVQEGDQTVAVVYLEHPVEQAEKKKWRDKGYKIIDARFDPNPKAKPEVVKFDREKAIAYLAEKKVEHAKNISNKDLETLVAETAAKEGQ